MFQKNVTDFYLSQLDNSILSERYERYSKIFLDKSKQENIRSSKEEQYQEGFLRDLFVSVLGYTIKPENNFNLFTEAKNDVKNKSNSKKADGAICEENNENNVKAVIELKGTSTKDLDLVAFQAFSYKNFHNDCKHIIVSNFEKLRFYVEVQSDFEEFDLFKLSFDRFCVLYVLLEVNQIKNDVALKIKNESLSEEKEITNNFYADYSTFKRCLFEDLTENNRETDKLLLFKKTQKLLDRILFVLFCEDRNLLPANSIMGIISDYKKLKELGYYQPLYNVFKTFFNRIDKGFKHESDNSKDVFAYNGGLFKTDEILDNVKIGDDVLYIHAQRLANYDFQSQISVDILGRIFENSLTEIEEVQKEIENEKNGIKAENNNLGKRKKDGVFYTPEYITKYIVENTIGVLCGRKRKELEINEETYNEEKKYTASQRKELEKRLTDYRNWLFSLRILDPACGSGAFLNAALKQLRKEHKLIDTYFNAIQKERSLNFESIENDNSILENNLYGVDINEDSIEITKLSLWLNTAKKNRKLTTLNDKIKCGNSLIADESVAGEKAFVWEKEFPEVFAPRHSELVSESQNCHTDSILLQQNHGGFDVVIGNPPYVTRGINEHTKKYINQNFETAEYQLDLYVCFMEKAIKLLKLNGYVGFIVPNSWLKNLMMSKCRQFMLERLNLTDIVRTTDVFSEASVDTLVYIGNKSDNQSDDITISDFKNTNAILSHKSSKSHFKENKNFIFDIEVNDSMVGIIAKMNENVVKINDLFDVCRGINPYDKYTGQSEEVIKTKAYHADYKKDETFVPLLQGRHIGRYFDSWDEKTFISYGDWLAAPREAKYFTGKRIVFREILGKTLISTILTDDIKIDRSLYIALPLNENVNIYYVEGILNSVLMSTFFRYTSNEFDDLFPKMRVAEFRELPIKVTTEEKQNEIACLVQKILEMSSAVQKKATRFLGRIKETYSIEKITQNLENFYTLSFADFVKELSKQKVKLSMKQKDELEDYFDDYVKEITSLTAQIEEADREINSLVYALYGLTEEEIAVVEKS